MVATPGALEALKQASENAGGYLLRHMSCDWGDMSDEDKQLNEDAIKNGRRVMSVHHTSQGEKLYVITEADRSVTTVLLPEEY